ncbi:hypothetical protein [Arcanobacterium haemolyticum]
MRIWIELPNKAPGVVVALHSTFLTFGFQWSIVAVLIDNTPVRVSLCCSSARHRYVHRGVHGAPFMLAVPQPHTSRTAIPSTV